MIKNKFNIFIDFEAITYPFYNFVHNREKFALPKNELPIAYTLGMYDQNGKFHFVTQIFKFKIDENFCQKGRNSIIQSLLKIDNTITIENCVFWAFEKNMEENVLHYFFDETIVVMEFNDLIYQGLDFSSAQRIGIKELTQNFNDHDYFFNTKQQLIENTQKRKLNRQFMKVETLVSKAGILASFICYWIYKYNNKDILTDGEFALYTVSLEYKTVLQELRKYSQDDVLRMDYIYRNIPEIQKMILLISDYRSKSNQIKRKYQVYSNAYSSLKKFIDHTAQKTNFDAESHKIKKVSEFILNILQINYLDFKESEEKEILEVLTSEIAKLKHNF
ncbi:hypothetical protein NV226_02290 [Mycoplasma iguanae]|uniref:DUF2779 domain-containing protein n=1 Tax=Mycoplasma iguanae TaxID=292461 RepID=A0ABY5RB10_9MOLU|nr:hypothetical protein [Mycoplasma iguanae]UVD81537.1 hypothetical protein NV226_02290 [Mycoplasma iguanae]